MSPENIEGLARIAREVNIPLASGERVANIHNMRELIEREIIDYQPSRRTSWPAGRAESSP